MHACMQAPQRRPVAWVHAQQHARRRRRRTLSTQKGLARQPPLSPNFSPMSDLEASALRGDGVARRGERARGRTAFECSTAMLACSRAPQDAWAKWRRKPALLTSTAWWDR